jgi:hypothetical protein
MHAHTVQCNVVTHEPLLHASDLSTVRELLEQAGLRQCTLQHHCAEHTPHYASLICWLRGTTGKQRAGVTVPTALLHRPYQPLPAITVSSYESTTQQTALLLMGCNAACTHRAATQIEANDQLRLVESAPTDDIAVKESQLLCPCTKLTVTHCLADPWHHSGKSGP